MSSARGGSEEDEIDTEQRFRDIWLYCMLDHDKGGMHSGPCTDCIASYARSGPPDDKWNQLKRAAP